MTFGTEPDGPRELIGDALHATCSMTVIAPDRAAH
jgi:hypothetical protein